MERKGTNPTSLFSLKEMEKVINKEPYFQRAEVWSKQRKKDLIDSILKKYHIGEFMFSINKNNGYNYDIVDGKQRITTIIEFMNNEFNIKNDTIIEDNNVSGLFYRDLPEDIKTDFHRYSINIVEMQGESNEIEEQFKRAQNGMPLNHAERRNANSGFIKDFINEVLNHNFFTVTMKIDKNTNNKRLGYNNIIEKFILLEIEGLYDLCNSNIDKMYSKYENGISDKYKERIINTLDYMYDALGDNTPYISKVALIGLYMVASEQSKTDINKTHTGYFANWFRLFEKRRKEQRKLRHDETDEIFRDYFGYVDRATSKIESLKGRKEILTKDWNVYLNSKLKEISKREKIQDKFETYTPYQRQHQQVSNF